MCKIVLLKTQCAFKAPGILVKLKIQIQQDWGEACDTVFLTSSKVMLVLLVQGLHSEEKGFILVVFFTLVAHWNSLEYLDPMPRL